MNPELSSVADVIAALGGKSASAEICNVTVSAIYNWEAENRFPAYQRWRIETEIGQRGLAVDPTLFPNERRKAS